LRLDFSCCSITNRKTFSHFCALQLTVCIWLVAVSKHFTVHRGQLWLQSENLTGSRSPAISYMRCCV